MIQPSSQRAALAPPSPIRKLVPLAKAARARGISVFHLNIGQPDIETPPAMRAALTGYDEDIISYGPSAGTDSLREFLFAYYHRIGVDLLPDELIVTTGGSEAILFAMAGCLDPGQAVLVPDPMYANYRGMATLLGVRVEPIPTRVDDGYHLPEDLGRFVTDDVRAVLLSNPSNPTGTVYTPDEMERLVALARERDLFIIVDEVYREFVYDVDMPASILTHPSMEDRAVLVDSLSKRYSLCGARIGCLASRNRQIMAGALAFAQARLCPPKLSELVAAQAVRLAPSYFDAARDEYRRRREVVYQALSSMGSVVHRPEGAFYQMARLPVDDAEGFVRFMLESFDLDGETTMVAPAAGFYATPDRGLDEVRIAYVLNERDLARAMEVLEAGLSAYADRR